MLVANVGGECRLRMLIEHGIKKGKCVCGLCCGRIGLIVGIGTACRRVREKSLQFRIVVHEVNEVGTHFDNERQAAKKLVEAVRGIVAGHVPELHGIELPWVEGRGDDEGLTG